MAYIGHFDHIPQFKGSESRSSGTERLARWGYVVVLGAIALVPIAVPLLVKHLGISF